jgi:hypothetical protein
MNLLYADGTRCLFSGAGNGKKGKYGSKVRGRHNFLWPITKIIFLRAAHYLDDTIATC